MPPKSRRLKRKMAWFGFLSRCGGEEAQTIRS
jgi:hypothetical protein